MHVENRPARPPLRWKAESIAAQQAFHIPFCRFSNGFAVTSKLGGFEDDFWLKHGALQASAVTLRK